MTNPFLLPNEIREVHVEPTSRCQCLCPQCARSPNGQLNRFLPLQHLPLSLLTRFFTPELSQNLDCVYFCGNYGDPNVYPHLFEALNYLKDQSVKKLRVFTNGTANITQWWSELATILDRPHDMAIFSIDGLQDTNHLYRVHSKWEAIMANAQAFLKAGGKARWEFLIFEHNKHQIKEAARLAQDMGFREFKLKKTKRFTQGNDFLKNAFISSTRISKNHQGVSTTTQLRMAVEQEAKDREQFSELVSEFDGLPNYFATTEIHCKYKSIGSLYLDFEGSVWPCCWMAAPKYLQDRTDHTVIEYEREIRAKWGNDFNSIEKHNLEEILSHEWLQQQLGLSWTAPTVENPRLSVCGRTCGTKMDFSSGFRSSSNALCMDLRSTVDLHKIDDFMNIETKEPFVSVRAQDTDKRARGRTSSVRYTSE